MFKNVVDNQYHNQLLKDLIDREKDLIETEVYQEDSLDIFINRALKGFKGLENMTTNELEDYVCLDPITATENYIHIFVDEITKHNHSSELDLLLQLLSEKNVQTKKLSQRKATLLNHLKDVMPNEKYEVVEPCQGDDTVYCVKEESGESTYFKVYTEEECIIELADWYESDIKCYLFPVEHIAETLSMSKETVLALGLLDNVTDALVGEGTEQLLNLLKKLNLLQVLAAYSKENNFMVLATDHYAYKVGDYYILEEENYYEGASSNV